MKDRQIIRSLRKKIPAFECKKWCSDCCGPVPFSKWEWNRIKNKKEAHSLTCPYTSSEGCEIYKDRPIICRLFGAVNTMRLICPHGCAPVKMLTETEADEIMKEYLSLMN